MKSNQHQNGDIWKDRRGPGNHQGSPKEFKIALSSRQKCADFDKQLSTTWTEASEKKTF